MPLAHEEIDDLSREMVKGNKSVNWLCGKVIAAYEEKLREQEPVAFYDGNKFYANEESASMCCADMEKLKPLFTRPAPIPEGWTLVPTEILDAFPEINLSNYDHDDACKLNAWGVGLVLAVARGEE